MSFHKAIVAVLFLLPGILSAGTLGFVGPWAPVDSQGAFINGFHVTLDNPQSNDPRYLTASLSADSTILTMYFVYPGDSSGWIFFDQGSGNLQPTGNVSYDWQITITHGGYFHWLVETNVVTTLPASGQPQAYGPGSNTFSGHTSHDYVSGGYYSFGNTMFSGDYFAYPAYAGMVLTNFVFTPSASESVPEPASIALAALGLAGALTVRRRRYAVRR